MDTLEPNSEVVVTPRILEDIQNMLDFVISHEKDEEMAGFGDHTGWLSKFGDYGYMVTILSEPTTEPDSNAPIWGYHSKFDFHVTESAIEDEKHFVEYYYEMETGKITVVNGMTDTEVPIDRDQFDRFFRSLQTRYGEVESERENNV